MTPGGLAAFERFPCRGSFSSWPAPGFAANAACIDLPEAARNDDDICVADTWSALVDDRLRSFIFRDDTCVLEERIR